MPIIVHTQVLKPTRVGNNQHCRRATVIQYQGQVFSLALTFISRTLSKTSTFLEEHKRREDDNHGSPFLVLMIVVLFQTLNLSNLYICCSSRILISCVPWCVTCNTIQLRTFLGCPTEVALKINQMTVSIKAHYRYCLCGRSLWRCLIELPSCQCRTACAWIVWRTRGASWSTRAARWGRNTFDTTKI